MATIFLADTIHDQLAGSNNISTSEDFTIPLNVANLAAYLKTHSAHANDLEIRIFKSPSSLIEALEISEPDILGMSNYGWNTDLNRTILDSFRKRCPQMLTVFGGPSIRTDREGISAWLQNNLAVDVYVMYEGEKSFRDLVDLWFEKGRSFLSSPSSLENCAYLIDRGGMHFIEAKIDHGLEDFPSPYLNGSLDSFLAKGMIPLFETNRGCPFACTFCTWGISALSKIRQLPEERVRDEMNYVAKRFPDLDAWILADANFGILHRDVEIARNIARIREVTPALRRVLIWESKNTSERNFTIAHLLGHADAKNGRVLIAIQTFEEDALGATKRGNIKFDDIRENINDFHEMGIEVRTDVIFGLPGETYEGHLDTLRKCFDVGFDHITTVNAILLAGSEMEARETRDKYDLKTRHQIRMGSYGEYRGLRTIETEEIVRQTSLFSEEEIESLHGLHWLLWYGWNYGFLKPVLKYLQIEHSANPLDVLLDIHRVGITEQENLVALFSALHAELRASFFISPQEAKAHYFENESWKYLMRGQFIKPEKKTNAKVILNPQLGLSLLDALISITPIEYQTDTFNDLVTVAKNRRVNLAVTHNRADHNSMEMTISKGAAKYLHSERRHHTQDYELSTNGMVTDEAQSRILIERTQSDQLRLLLHKYNFDVDPLFAVERILGTAHHLLQYQIEKACLEPAAVSILKS